MTGNSFKQQNSKDVPQFAPNFTVYVLPPDVVCLYSEDRKFFLHGEIFCALASAIGEGGRSAQVTMYWLYKGEKLYTEFSEFSADGRTMAQLKGESGPRRSFHRS